MKKIDLSELPPEILEEAREAAEDLGEASPVAAYRVSLEELPYLIAHIKAGGDPNDFSTDRLKKLHDFAQSLPSAKRCNELADLREKSPEDLTVRREIFTIAVAMFLHSPCMNEEVGEELDKFIRAVFPEIVRGTVKGGGDSPLGKALEAYEADISALSAYRDQALGPLRPNGETLQ